LKFASNASQRISEHTGADHIDPLRIKKLYKKFLSELSNSRIIALSLERSSYKWLIGRKIYDPETAIKLDGKKFKEMAIKIRDENLAMMQDPNYTKEISPYMFQPKGSTNIKTVLTVSITGPIGMPMEEAVYPPVNTSDGTKMNAMNDYVIKMSKDELPPSEAFWSLTLYDEVNGFFIPNDRKKYSVGKNAGFVLNDKGGIEIYVAAEQPEGVPSENWLPINREDLDLNLILRSYVTDLEKYKTWKAPVAVKIEK